MNRRSGFLALLPILILGSCGSSDSDAYLERCTPSLDSDGRQGNPLPSRAPRLAAEATRLLRKDPEARSLIGGSEFTVGRAIPWSAGDGSDATGFVIGMNFREPFSASSDSWPVVIYPGAGRSDSDTTPRLLCRIGLEADGVRKIQATVNLTSGRVEDMSASGSRVEYEDLGALPEKYRPVPGY